MTAYPDGYHASADERARERVTAALNCIEGEVMITRRAVRDGADHDTEILTNAVRRLTQNLEVLETLRRVRAWHAAGKAEATATEARA